MQGVTFIINKTGGLVVTEPGFISLKVIFFYYLVDYVIIMEKIGEKHRIFLSKFKHDSTSSLECFYVKVIIRLYWVHGAPAVTFIVMGVTTATPRVKYIRITSL